MKTLISPPQVIALAFADGEFLPPATIAEDDIAAAEERYIVPVVGPTLYEKLLDGAYPDLLNDYLAAPAAFFTRLAVQPRLDVRTQQCGTTAPRSSDYQPAGTDPLRELQRSLRRQARTLLRRASAYLDAHAARFPEYDPEKNILKHCSIDGNFVQIY